MLEVNLKGDQSTFDIGNTYLQREVRLTGSAKETLHRYFSDW